MRRTAVLACSSVLLAYLGGCAAPAEKPDPVFQTRKLEQERDTARQQLNSEQAKNAALAKRLETNEEELKAARAKTGNLTEQVDRLTKHNAELQGVLDDLKTRELKRPTVPASPLPAKSDELLQALATKYGDRVWYDRGRGAISFANDRLFDSGSDIVRSDAHAGLTDLAGVLSSSDLADYEMIVIGHTDAAPITKPETLEKHPTNWHLSVHRAIAVKDVLVKAGLPATRLGVMGYADNRPAGKDPAQNRRVEIFIVRKGGVQPFQPVAPVRTKG